MDKWAGLEDGFGFVERGQVGALEEFADGDFVAPEQRLLHGCPVGGVVGGIVFELFDARAEPLEGVVVVVGDAGAEDVDEGEALVGDGLLDELGEVLLVGAEAARDEGGAGSQGEGDGIDGRLELPKGMLLVFMPRRLVGEVWPVVRP